MVFNSLGRFGQGFGDATASRISFPPAFRNGVVKYHCQPLIDVFGGYSLVIPKRLQNRHYVGSGDRVNGLAPYHVGKA